MPHYFDRKSNSFIKDAVTSDCIVQIMWHITNVCNCACLFCFDRANRTAHEQHVAEGDIFEITRTMVELGVEKVDISGGEPLLCKTLIPIVEASKQFNISLTITTSGFGLKENITWLKLNWSDFSRVILSLDGDQSVHNHLRRNPDSYSAFNNLLQSLKGAGCTNSRINTVVTKQLLDKDSLSSLFKEIEQADPLEWCLIQPHPHNKLPTFDSLCISDDQFVDFVSICSKEASVKPKILIRNNELYSAYWRLNPNGVLSLIDNKFTESDGIVLNSDNLETIRQLSAMRTQRLPV
jgi:molybdenum cofactor biosynthesis enzyme MoaA